MPGKLASEGGAAEIKFLVDSGRLKVIEVTDVNNFSKLQTGVVTGYQFAR
jgi:hypothetical protein